LAALSPPVVAADSAGLSEIDVLPREAVTSLTASETFSTMVDMIECGGWLTEDELEVFEIGRRSLRVN
jgi:hypothetical protein